MHLISVIVPVYKVEKYLDRCVESILAQTYRNFELILVDDGSPDNCGVMCDDWATKDPRIIVIHKKNGGLSDARNVGLDVAKGEYITFIDSDDIVDWTYLQRLYSAIINNNADASVCGFYEFTNTPMASVPATDSISFYTGRDYCKCMYDHSIAVDYVIACAKMWKKDVFDTVRFPVGRRHEDNATTYRLMYNLNKIAVVSDKLYGYYINDKGLTKSNFSLTRYDSIIALSEAEHYYKEKNDFELAEMVAKHKKLACAMLSLSARKAGIYNKVEKQYKMSFFKADKTIRAQLGYNAYEHYMYTRYPKWVKLQAKLRRLFKIK